jgi:hypothetical protein
MVQKELKNFLNDFEKGFLNGIMDGEKMESHRKGFLNLKCFSPPKILTSPLFEETLGAFLSLPLFSPFFLFFFLFALSLEDLGILMIFEEKVTSSKTSF